MLICVVNLPVLRLLLKDPEAASTSRQTQLKAALSAAPPSGLCLALVL